MNGNLQTNLRAAYNGMALQRDQHLIEPWKIEERQKFLAALQVEHKQTVLESVAGTERDSQFFQTHGFQVVCADQSIEMVKLCQRKRLTAYVTDFRALPFPNQSFDAVYALNCLLHVPKAELPAVLHEIHRVLKPDSIFYMGGYGGYEYEGVWSEDTYDSKRFFAFYTDEHIQAIVTEVFAIDSFKLIKHSDNDSGLHVQSLLLRLRQHIPEL